MHRPPPAWLYYDAWLLLVAGAVLVIASPFFMEWEPLVLGLCGLMFAIPFMGLLAWMRDRYNEWHLEDRGRIDDLGFPLSRLQLRQMNSRREPCI